MNDLKKIYDVEELEIPLEEMTDAWIEQGNYSQQTVADLRNVLIMQKARNDIFGECLHRALKLWQKEYPDAEFWPSGDTNLAWVFERLLILEDSIKNIKELNIAIKNTMHTHEDFATEEVWKKCPRCMAEQELTCFLEQLKISS